MSSSEHSLGPPHFPLTNRDGGREELNPQLPSAKELPLTGVARDVAALLLRGAECLAAALLECTSEAGLNEARYRVLDSLKTRGECSQSELAVQLLQSESNLSTLLDRMGGDGLITRTRSQTDRRRSLIRMTPIGLEALSQAEQTRAATTGRLLRFFSSGETDQLAELLQRLVGDLEKSPEVSARRSYSIDPPVTSPRGVRQSPVAMTTSAASRNDRS